MSPQLNVMSQARATNRLATKDGTGDWREQAACRTEDPNHWDVGDDYAKTICDTVCPVAAECLTYILKHEQGGPEHRSGMFAGMGPADRANLTRRNRRRTGGGRKPKPPTPPAAPKTRAPKPPSPPRTRAPETRPRPADCPDLGHGARARHRAAKERPCAACAAWHAAQERAREATPATRAQVRNLLDAGHDPADIADRVNLPLHALDVLLTQLEQTA